MPRKKVVLAAGAIDDGTAAGGSASMAQSTAAGGEAPSGSQSGGGSHTLIGNGPSTAIASSAVTQRPVHTGKREDFAVFDITFKSYLRIIGLHQVLTQDNPNASENAPHTCS